MIDRRDRECGNCAKFHRLRRAIIAPLDCVGGICNLHEHNTDELHVCEDWEGTNDVG